MAVNHPSKLKVVIVLAKRVDHCLSSRKPSEENNQLVLRQDIFFAHLLELLKYFTSNLEVRKGVNGNKVQGHYLSL